jgi:hypothetical protein
MMDKRVRGVATHHRVGPDEREVHTKAAVHTRTVEADENAIAVFACVSVGACV